MRRVAGFGVVPHLLVIGVLTLAVRQCLPTVACDTPWGWCAPLIALAVYFLATTPLRMVVLRHQRRAARSLAAGDLLEAIDAFKHSYAFFSQHTWLDNWRHVLLFGFRRAGFREQALCGIGFCYEQFGNFARAEDYYERTLEEFPGSVIATSSLRALAGKGKRQRRPPS